MRRQDRAGLRAAALVGLALLTAAASPSACGRPDSEGTAALAPSASDVRAARRAYDGAPPVAPHEDFGSGCTDCHNMEGIAIEGLGFAPPLPHGRTLGMSAFSRCRQCHVFARTKRVFVPSRFEGLRQDLRKGRRLSAVSPPMIPHSTFMRENCLACHSGRAAREEIRTPHPERIRCRQCHVPAVTTATFRRG